MEEALICTVAVKSQQNQNLREQMQRETQVLEKGHSLCRMHMNRKALSMLFSFHY